MFMRSTLTIGAIVALLVWVADAYAVGDTDMDGVNDDVDNCILVPNPDQRDADNDGYGSLCDPDLDDDCIVTTCGDSGDLACQVLDTDEANMWQVFFTSDANADLNGDGIVNFLDLGILRSYAGEPPGPSGLPPTCRPDVDNDNVPDDIDNCLLVQNPGQTDSDGDGYGNMCDPDLDDDCIVTTCGDPGDPACQVLDTDEALMLSVFFTNPASPNWDPDADLDSDGIVNFLDLFILRSYAGLQPGPAADNPSCPPDTDWDGIGDHVDNCFNVANTGQEDFDGDGVGYACDVTCATSMDFVHDFSDGDVFDLQASGTISYEGAMADGADISFDAGGGVELRFNTIIWPGSIFSVFTTGCVP